jgi:hypothetical protein
MLDTPILFLIFNRPDFTEQAFSQIQKVQPKQLFIAADGPRDNKPGEKDLCEAARNIVMHNIVWPCEIKTMFREKNAGCSIATVEAMTWFFNNVERGIMIEDDCLASPSFFRLCDELLEHYKNDERIIAINGVNYLFEHDTNSSYFFSVLGASWGLATWKRAWEKFDYSINAWRNKDVKRKIRKFINDDNLFKYYAKIFDWHLKDTGNGVWDYRWLFCRLYNQGLTVLPAINQIKNIGFGPGATHTLDADSKMAKLETRELAFPLRLNNHIAPDYTFDSRIYAEIIKPTLGPRISLVRKILRRLKRIWNRVGLFET